MVATATGEIEADAIGFCLVHEHVVVSWPPMEHAYPDLIDHAGRIADTVRTYRAVRDGGVDTIVDVTPIDLGRDVGLLTAVAQGSGLQVIAATGFYSTAPLWFLHRPLEAMVDFLVAELDRGIAGTTVRAGIIKCLTELPVDDATTRVLRACARAHLRTGAPITTHANAERRTGLAEQAIFAAEGVDLTRVVIGHVDDSADISYCQELADNGSYIGFDRFGRTSPRSTDERIDMLVELIDRGYQDHILLSHDAPCVADFAEGAAWRADAPDWHPTAISRVLLPALAERGVAPSTIRQLTVGNPRRLFGGA